MSYDSLVPFPLGMLYDFVCIPIVVGALGIVEDAILLGAPVSGDEKSGDLLVKLLQENLSTVTAGLCLIGCNLVSVLCILIL